MDLPPGAFTVRRRITFAHCDPAGIVFYPEFFRMFNDLFEEWFEVVLGVPMADEFLVHGRMFPFVHVDTDFKIARRMGDNISLTLVLHRLGRSSMHYSIHGHDEGREIPTANLVTCVASKETMKTIPFPDYMRRPLEAYLASCGGAGA